MADDPRAALRQLEASLRELAGELAGPPRDVPPPGAPVPDAAATQPRPEVAVALRDLRGTLEALATAAAAPARAPGDAVAVELASARDPAAVLDFYEELKEVPGVRAVYLRGAVGGRALFEVALEPRGRP